jgi:hypothetical protein
MEQMESQDHNILTQVRSGMDVVDSEGNDIGWVEEVFMGGVSNDQIEMGGREAEAPGIDLNGPDDPGEMLARIFTVDNDVPRELAERLLRNGYVLIKRNNLIGSHRFVQRDQIASVDQHLHLSVPGDRLYNP